MRSSVTNKLRAAALSNRSIMLHLEVIENDDDWIFIKQAQKPAILAAMGLRYATSSEATLEL